MTRKWFLIIIGIVFTVGLFVAHPAYMPEGKRRYFFWPQKEHEFLLADIPIMQAIVDNHHRGMHDKNAVLITKMLRDAGVPIKNGTPFSLDLNTWQLTIKGEKNEVD